MTKIEDDIVAIIENAVREIPKIELARILREKFEELGIQVSRIKLRAASEHLLSGSEDDFNFGNKAADAAAIVLTDEDANAIIAKAENFIRDDLPRILLRSSDEAAADFYKTLENRWPREQRAQLKQLSRFKRNLEHRYGSGLAKLRMLIGISIEWGQGTYSRRLTANNGTLPHLDDVLLRLHVRACQIATEIAVLLETGLADGAMARWRALHEVSTIAMLISDHGEDVAKRYVRYQIVESKKALTAYEACRDDLGYKPYSDKEKNEIADAYQSAIEEYGVSFGGEYGWISHILGEGSRKRVTFANLQKAAGMGFMRAHYQMASYNVHASPKGIYFKLGHLEPASDVLLAGVSNAGLVEPAQNAALTLGKITLLVCNAKDAPAFENIVFVKVVDQLTRAIPGDFGEADAKLKLDDRYVRRYGRAPRRWSRFWRSRVFW